MPSGKPAGCGCRGSSAARLLPASTTRTLEVEAGEIDGGGQPGRAAADDQAIEWVIVHRLQRRATAIVPCGVGRRRRYLRCQSRGEGTSCRENVAAGRSAARCPGSGPCPGAGAGPRRRQRRSSSSSPRSTAISAPSRPSSTCRAWSGASSATAASSMSGARACSTLDARRPVDAGQPVPHRLDEQGVHRARHPEAARRGPAVARRAGRDLCPGAARLALSDQRIRPRIRVRDLLSHVGGFVTDDPWGDRQSRCPRPSSPRMLRAGVPVHPGAADGSSNIPISAMPCSAGSSPTSRAGPSRTISRQEIMRPLGMASTGYDIVGVAAGAPRARLSLGE